MSLCKTCKCSIGDSEYEHCSDCATEEDLVRLEEYDATKDWKYEVANGDTVLGLTEWRAHKAESEKHDLILEKRAKRLKELTAKGKKKR